MFQSSLIMGLFSRFEKERPRKQLQLRQRQPIFPHGIYPGPQDPAKPNSHLISQINLASLCPHQDDLFVVDVSQVPHCITEFVSGTDVERQRKVARTITPTETHHSSSDRRLMDWRDIRVLYGWDIVSSHHYYSLPPEEMRFLGYPQERKSCVAHRYIQSDSRGAIWRFIENREESEKRGEEEWTILERRDGMKAINYGEDDGGFAVYDARGYRVGTIPSVIRQDIYRVIDFIDEFYPLEKSPVETKPVEEQSEEPPLAPALFHLLKDSRSPFLCLLASLVISNCATKSGVRASHKLSSPTAIAAPSEATETRQGMISVTEILLHMTKNRQTYHRNQVLFEDMQIDAPYPPEAREKSVEGRIIIDVTVEKGRIVEVKVRRSLPGGLESAIVKYLKERRFPNYKGWESEYRLVFECQLY